jgi:hypothetical protein
MSEDYLSKIQVSINQGDAREGQTYEIYPGVEINLF